jgi:hypothetical protein
MRLKKPSLGGTVRRPHDRHCAFTIRCRHGAARARGRCRRAGRMAAKAMAMLHLVRKHLQFVEASTAFVVGK